MKDIQAFPSFNSDGYLIEEGMTLRDWFAGMALQGLFSSPHKLLANGISKEFTERDLSKMSYNIADAMMKVRGE